MKKLLLLCVYIFTLYSQSPLLFDDAVTKPNAHHIIELDCELFMVHMIPDMPTGSNYKVYNFPATINSSGLFQLAGDITNSLTISANNVTLDMQGHTASGGLIISTGRQNVTIKDGVIDVAHAVQNAVNVQSGASQIALDSLKVRNAINNGIALANVTDSTIRNCDLSSNTTGIQLSSSKNIIIENCVATANTNAGFDCISSVTCLVTKCKAMSTGQSNNQTSDQTIFGFVSANGNGNIFEQCIANGTQGLSVIDRESLVAGFALRGSESCSKIINSESCNTQTSENGYAVPVGILLEETLDSLATSVLLNITTNTPNVVAWSPDGNYIAIYQRGASSTLKLDIYEYDRINNEATLIASSQPLATGGASSNPGALSWSADGKYLITGTTDTGTGNSNFLFLFESNQLTLLDSFGTQRCSAAEFSPDVNYFVTSCRDDDMVNLYTFNRITQQKTLVDSVLVTGANIVEMKADWHPSGNYVAVAQPDLNFQIYKIENNTLITLPNGSDTPGTTVRTVAWDNTGNYLAVGVDSEAHVYSFINESVVSIDSVTAGGLVLDIAWSPNGKYIILSNTSGPIQIYFFDGNTISPSPINRGTSAIYRLASFSPDGNFIFSGLNAGSVARIFTGFDFPSNNVIKDNTVYCNSGGSIPSGIGISGSSILNLIIGNTCYNNPRNPFQVYTNYAFVTNVFNPLFEQNPTALENIGIMGPIQTPLDIALMAQQIEVKLCSIQDTITSLLP